MSHTAQLLDKPLIHPDYSLTGVNSTLAIEKGLAEADWYQCPVPRETMRKLLERRDGPAIRDTILWFALIFGVGYCTWRLWGIVVGHPPLRSSTAVLYASTSDSRWHESGHGTAFKTDWMNNALYEIASFMVMRESVGLALEPQPASQRHHHRRPRPEIAVPRPPNLEGHRSWGSSACTSIRSISAGSFSALRWPHGRRGKHLHSRDRVSQGLPARAHLFPHLRTGGRAGDLLAQHSSRCMLVGLTNFFGSWLMLDLRHDPARRPGGKCARSSPELPDGLHEPDQPLSLLEHELPRRAPHVPAGALSCAAQAARRGKERLPHALSEHSDCLARDHSRRSAGR